MRIAFTIIFNGLHHLHHNNYAEFILKNFDYWVVVEGVSKSNGTTSWCKKIPDELHNNGASVDGTIEYLKNLSIKFRNLIFIKSDGFWNSKDDMVNKCIEEIKKITEKCFLWKIDCDEQWTEEQILKSEKELIEKNGKTGLFYANNFVGKDLIAIGKDWGGSTYNRLWDWCGEFFQTHESPVLRGGNGNCIILSEKFNHYSYYFEQDVSFKDKWYSRHKGCFDRWKKLQNETMFPKHITYLFPYFGGIDSNIIKIK